MTIEFSVPFGLVPDEDHVAVHVLELLLGDLEGVRRRVQLVRLETLVAQVDLEGLIVGLRGSQSQRNSSNNADPAEMLGR